MMTIYTPDNWVVLAITQPLAKCVSVEDRTLYKIFATWRGGYTTGDSWRTNSGSESVSKDSDYYYVKGYSGSVYELHKDGYGLSGYSSSVLSHMIADSTVRLLSEEESLEYLERMSHEHISN